MNKSIKILIFLCVFYMVAQVIRTWGLWEIDSQDNIYYIYEEEIESAYYNRLLFEDKVMIQEVISVMSEPIEESIQELEEICEFKITYYDIPLSKELQDYTNELCSEYDVSQEIIYAMMYVESNYQTNIISKTNDYGIMQINEINHSWLRDEYGVDDFLNAEQNILCGVIMISELYEKYGDIHKALMAYNCGETGAKRLWDQGYTSSKYSRKIVEYAERLTSNIKKHENDWDDILH